MKRKLECKGVKEEGGSHRGRRGTNDESKKEREARRE